MALIYLLGGGRCLSPQAADSQSDGLFPTPSAGMVVQGRGAHEHTLEELLREFGATTGENLTWSEDTELLLKATHPGLDRALEIPAEALYSVVETILIRNRLAFIDITREEPRVLAVIQLDQAPSEPLSSQATYVSPEELSIYAEHPAIKITTVVTLEHLDGKTMGRALRALVADPNSLTMVPDLGAKQLTLTGYGPALADLVRILHDLNESARLHSESR